MRAYSSFHSDAKFLDRYNLRDSSELIGGTVLGQGRFSLRQRFERISKGSKYLNVTLSLPKGMQADRALWESIAIFQLGLMALDPVKTPWIAARHTDSECDHVHIAIALRQFDGMEVRPRCSKLQTERNHIAMARRLGLETPIYFNPDIPTLTPPLPSRRLHDPRARQLAGALCDVFRQTRPRNIEEFDAALSRCNPPITRLELPNRNGGTYWRFEQAGFSRGGGGLGSAFEPHHIKSRLAYCEALSQGLRRLDIMAVFRAVKPYLNSIERILNDADTHPTDIAHQRRTLTQDPRRNGQESREASPAARSAGGGRHGTLLGDRAGPARRIEAHSEGASGIPEPAPRFGEADRSTHGIRQRNKSNATDHGKTDRGNAPPASGASRKALRFGMWLGQVIQILHQNFAGARWRFISQHGLHISFVDRSSVICSPDTCEVNSENADALKFRDIAIKHGLVRREIIEPAPPSEETPEIYGP